MKIQVYWLSVYKLSCLLLIILSGLTTGSKNDDDNKIEFELDEDIKDDVLLMTRAVEEHLAGHIKRGFTNIGVKQLSKIFEDETNNNQTVFDYLSFKGETGNHINIKDFRFFEPFAPRMLRSVPNLIYNIIEIDVDLSDIKLTGYYEAFNTELFDIIPLVHEGRIDVTIENVKATGLIGVFRVDDTFYAENFNIKYQTGRVEIKFYKQSPYNFKTVRKESLSDSFLEPIESQFWGKISRIIQNQLNEVLSEISIHDTLRDEDFIDQYTKRTERLDLFVNKFVDRFINEMISDFSNYYKLSNIELPDFDTGFTYDAGLVTVNGNFIAQKGTVSDLSSIQRRGRFSLFSNKTGHTMIIFGGLGFDKFEVKYDYYRAELLFLKPFGNIDINVGDNAMNFALTAPTLYGIPDFKKLHYDFSINRLEGLDIKLTGLSNGPLDWLASRIVTWMAGNCKSSIKKRVEDQLRKYIDGSLKESINWDFKITT